MTLYKNLITVIFFHSQFILCQNILIEKDFEGGNIEVLLINNSLNTITVKPEFKNGDTRASHFFFKVKGFNKSIPLKVNLYTDESYYAPEMAGVSVDLTYWDRIQAVQFSGYVQYTKLLVSDSAYFAIGYPYVYSDMINLLNNAGNHKAAVVSDLTISEGGREVKLLKITEPAVDDSSKFLIWIIARQHAFESHSNYVIGGLINFLVSEDSKAKTIRNQAITCIVPVMDIDQVYEGGTGKDQLPVDFNRDWDSPSHWNAVNAVKNLVEQTSALNNFEVFIDSHNPWPGNNTPEHSLYFYTIYQSGPKSYNVNFYRDLFESISGYPVGREPMYQTIGQTSKTFMDSVYNVGLNVSMETGWINRPDGLPWTIERYNQNGAYLGEALSDYINNLPLQNDIIIDNNDTACVIIEGDWVSSTYIEGFYGTDYLHDNNTGKGLKSVIFKPEIPRSGFYEVFLRWTSDPGRADNVPVDIIHSNGTTGLIINQKKKGAGWVSLGIYSLNKNSNNVITIKNDNTNGFVIADAVRLSSRDSILVDVKFNEDQFVLNDFILFENYPNPFNPTTTLSFVIGHSSLVNLKVYDMLGREVATLVNEEKPAGSYEVVFDASSLASGVYFFRLTATPILPGSRRVGGQAVNFVSTKKMILLR